MHCSSFQQAHRLLEFAKGDRAAQGQDPWRTGGHRRVHVRRGARGWLGSYAGPDVEASDEGESDEEDPEILFQQSITKGCFCGVSLWTKQPEPDWGFLIGEVVMQPRLQIRLSGNAKACRTEASGVGSSMSASNLI